VNELFKPTTRYFIVKKVLYLVSISYFIYSKVKRRLDYQVVLADLTRTVQHKTMVNWIVENVIKSIKDEKEKTIFKKCMLDLQALAAKA